MTNQEKEIRQDQDKAEETGATTPEKKKGKALYIVAALVGLYVVFGIVAIIMQEPAPEAPNSVLAEQYGAAIVRAHNELLGVRLEGELNPGEKLGGIKKTYATNELNKRIRAMRTHAELLRDLEPDKGDDPFPEDILQFATFILDEWVPFWEDVSARIKDVSTTDEALSQWADLKDTIEHGPEGQAMEQAFRSFAKVGEELGWEKESYTARIR